MFRKKQTKVLRVKDGKKRLSNFDIPYSKNEGELTMGPEVEDFLRDNLGLESIKILNGPTRDLSDYESNCEFCDYFHANEIVDILIPENANLDGWTLRQSAYNV